MPYWGHYVLNLSVPPFVFPFVAVVYTWKHLVDSETSRLYSMTTQACIWFYLSVCRLIIRNTLKEKCKETNANFYVLRAAFVRLNARIFRNVKIACIIPALREIRERVIFPYNVVPLLSGKTSYVFLLWRYSLYLFIWFIGNIIFSA